MLDAAGARLRDELLKILDAPVDSASDSAFEKQALATFAFQFERNLPYNAYCTRRGIAPDSVTHWTQIPPVPTTAFKYVDLVAGNAADAEAVFRTSGTTAGAEKRGTHYVLDVSLYNASLLPGFAARLLPDAAQLTMLSLIPAQADLPDSSLAHMVATVMQKFGAESSAYYATSRAGIDIDAFTRTLAKYTAANQPVCILGTSFSFVHLLDEMTKRNITFALPDGSRLMDTGGYKGKSREVPMDEMLTSYENMLGIPRDACVNEYGMTELCSQMYDVTLFERTRHGVAGARRKRPPSWLRVRIVDPVTLSPVSPGGQGLVQMFDLANIGSVCAIQTEDIGVQIDDGYRVLGRAPGAQPRGCSIAMDDMLQAVRDAKR